MKAVHDRSTWWSCRDVVIYDMIFIYLYSFTLYDFRSANSTPSSSLSQEKTKTIVLTYDVCICASQPLLYWFIKNGETENKSKDASKRSNLRDLLLLMVSLDKFYSAILGKVIWFLNYIYLYSITLFAFCPANSTPSSSLSPEKNKNISIHVRVYVN